MQQTNGVIPMATAKFQLLSFVYNELGCANRIKHCFTEGRTVPFIDAYLGFKT